MIINMYIVCILYLLSILSPLFSLQISEPQIKLINEFLIVFRHSTIQFGNKLVQTTLFHHFPSLSLSLLEGLLSLHHCLII